MAKRTIIAGNMPYRELANADTRRSFHSMYWDFWIAIVVVNICHGDWDALLMWLREQTKANYSQQENGEAMMAHVRQLRQTLDEAGLDVAALLDGVDDAFLKKETRKAVRKVRNLDFQPKETSQWMLLTPRKMRHARAMRGYWDRFPVNPAGYADALTRRYKTSGYYNENQSFGLETKLSGFLKKQTARAALPQQVAVYRAFLTVVIEKMEMVDDSCGVIGHLYGEAFAAYYGFERKQLAMPAEDFLQDLLELLIWEDYALTFRQLPGFFAGLSAEEAPIAEHILQQQWKELKELEIDSPYLICVEIYTPPVQKSLRAYFEANRCGT